MNQTVIALVAPLLLSSSTPLVLDVVQITDNDTTDRYPAISGSRVVWQHCDGGTGDSCVGGDQEIYFWDGSFPIVPIQITNDDHEDWYPAISGSTVVWQKWDGNDFEIYLWDGSFPIVPVQITNNGKDDEYPDISGSNVTWRQCDVNDDYQCSNGDTEIYYWDGSFPILPTRITDNDINDTMPRISGTKIVWEGYEDVLPIRAVDIYYWDGSAISRLTDDGALDWRPDISGSGVVWVGPRDGSQRILRWDGSYPVVPTAIPGSTVSGFLPAISGGNVVWQQGPTGSTDIYLWDGLTTTNISNDPNFQDDFADLSGSTVVWQRQSCLDFGDLGCLPGTSEIYMATVSGADAVPSISPAGFFLLTGLILAVGIYLGLPR